MNRKLAVALTLTLLIGTLNVALNVQKARATTTIYIRADGSIDPSGSPISTVDNVTYTLTGNITSDANGIWLERNDMTLDGAGFTVTGSGNGNGTTLRDRSNVTIRNMTISNFQNGIVLEYSSNSTLSGNNVTSNGWEGIWLDHSSDNTLSGNNVIAHTYDGILVDHSSDNTLSGNNVTSNNEAGIYLYLSSDNNVLSGNNLANNWAGIMLAYSSSNVFYHNNFINSTHHVYFFGPIYANSWDDGYPSGGNYWSGFAVSDFYSGIYQNETGSDGIGDVSYGIDANNTDRFPLMGPDYSFDAGTWNSVQYRVDIVSNSTVSGFYFNASEGAFLMFTVTGEGGTEGFWRVTIPRDLLWVEDGWIIVVQYPLFLPHPPPSSFKTFSDENCTYLYLTCTNPPQNSSATVTINGTHVIPEYPSSLILPLFMLATLLAAIVFRKKRVDQCSL